MLSDNLRREISEIDGNLARKRPICIVAQTTINRDFFGEIVQNAKKTCKSTLVFDTICSATKDRQTRGSTSFQRNPDMHDCNRGTGKLEYAESCLK